MRNHAGASLSYAMYVWNAIYNSLGRDLFVIMALVMASGNLMQEKEQGTLGFTLALPASRRHAVVVKALVGYLGVVAIAFVPVVLLPLASMYVGQHYPLSQALRFGFLWASCGSAIYALTLFLSYLMEGEYSAVLVAFPTLMIYGALLDLPWLSRLPMLNIFNLMNGEDMPFFDQSRCLITGPLPWLALLVALAVSTLFICAAGYRMQQREIKQIREGKL